MFRDALKFDLERRETEESQQHNMPLPRTPSQGSLYAQTAPSQAPLEGATAAAGPINAAHNQKEPTEVMLFGYRPSQQYAAVERYETISRGRILEEYPRDPPTQFRKFAGLAHHLEAVALNPEEKRKVNSFAGGKCWVKVTFDSALAADRAISESPQSIGGNWVYAELYRGVGPAQDTPISRLETDTDSATLRQPKPARRPSQTLSASFSTASIAGAGAGSRTASTLPRSFTTSTLAPTPESTTSLSSSTASSATITGANPLAASQSATYRGSTTAEVIESEHCRLIPSATKIKLRPAEEALLPTRTTAQVLASYLPFSSFFGGQLIGEQIPRKEDGQFDYSGASIYWKVWYWCDQIFGTDFCGLKEE